MWQPVTGLSLASQHAVNSQLCKCSQSHMRTFHLFCDLRSRLGNGSRITEMSHSMSTDKLTEFLLLFYYLCLCPKKASGKSKAAKPPDGCFLIWSFTCMRVHTRVCMHACMYVCVQCMCVHACVRVRACVHAHTCVCMYVHVGSVCVCMCVRVCMCTYVCTHKCVYTCVQCVRAHMCVCMCVHVCRVCMHVHVCMCIMCMHAHMCVHPCVAVCSGSVHAHTHTCVCVCPAVYCEHVCLCTGLPFSYRHSCSLRVGVGHSLYRIIF